jgi:two-component system sensor histidine kinase DegS
MEASPDNSAIGQVDSLHSIVRETLRALSAVEEKLEQLSDRVGAEAIAIEQDRGRVQHVADSLAWTHSFRLARPDSADTSALALPDSDQFERERRELDRRVEQSRGLRTNLQLVLQVVRASKEQFGEERAFRAPEYSDDLRAQQAMNAARESERRRLAREIHDGPAQVLANGIFVVGIAEHVVDREPAKVTEQLAALKTLLKDGVAEIRRFMFDLRPTMLEDQGLAPTLRYYVGEYNRMFAKQVSLQMCEPLPPLSHDEELCIFRIVQEALQNIQKHAATDVAWIRLDVPRESADQEIRFAMTIVDRGRGFNPATAAARQGHGVGVSGMRERARLIGADLTLESEPGQGTTVRLQIPRSGHAHDGFALKPGPVD